MELLCSPDERYSNECAVQYVLVTHVDNVIDEAIEY